MANPDLAFGALQKPEKGAAFKARKHACQQTKAFEAEEKRKVRLRDQRCRWPHCEHCRRYQPRLEVAHLVAKGMGGDRGLLSTADQMILLDVLTHQGGPDSLEQHGRKIEPLTAQGTDGPCAFYVRDAQGQWVLVAEETSVGVYRRD